MGAYGALGGGGRAGEREGANGLCSASVASVMKELSLLQVCASRRSSAPFRVASNRQGEARRNAASSDGAEDRTHERTRVSRHATQIDTR